VGEGPSVSEILALKQEASLALPRLRELLARRLAMPTDESVWLLGSWCAN
jgi:hypothetical protein